MEAGLHSETYLTKQNPGRSAVGHLPSIPEAPDSMLSTADKTKMKKRKEGKEGRSRS